MDGFAGLVPLEGGWSGRTFVAEVAGERQVVRFYDPGDDAALDVAVSVLRLVRGLVPVPDIFEARRGSLEADHPGLLVTSYVDGERGDLVLPRLDPASQATLGANIGELVATLGGMPMLRAGRFTGADLAVEPFDDGLSSWVEEQLAALLHWTADERAGLREVAALAQARLDTVERRVLVHSDLNPKNLLVDPRTLRISALVDWEFAHAGHPFTDLGNVLRFDRQPAYAQAVLGVYCARHDVDPDDALDLARAADLWALADLASRHGQGPVADRAERCSGASPGSVTRVGLRPTHPRRLAGASEVCRVSYRADPARSRLSTVPPWRSDSDSWLPACHDDICPPRNSFPYDEHHLYSSRLRRSRRCDQRHRVGS